MRLQANLRHDNAKKPEPLNEREWVLFIADIIFFPECNRIIFNTGVEINPPAGFKLVVELHPSLTYHELILMGKGKEITAGGRGPLMLIAANFSLPQTDKKNIPLLLAKMQEESPKIGQPIAVMRLDRLSEIFDIECEETPDKTLTTISNFN